MLSPLCTPAMIGCFAAVPPNATPVAKSKLQKLDRIRTGFFWVVGGQGVDPTLGSGVLAEGPHREQ